MSLAIGPIDLAIVAAYLVGVVLFGLWIGRGQRGIDDYLLGDRNLPWWVLLLSIVATETSTATFLSVPGMGYGGDLTFLQVAVGFLIGRYVVVAVLLPQYFRGELFTAYQVLDRRFGGAVKQAASLLFIVTRSFADGLRLLLAGIVLKTILFTGDASPAPGEFDQRLALAVAAMGFATILYTFFGGMKAVAWTDFIQFFIYMAGALVAGAVLLADLPDGWAGLVEFGREHEKFRWLNLSFNLTQPYTLWAGLIGGAFFSLGSHGADQLMVQRYLSARSQRQAGWALACSGWIVLAQFALFLMLGLGLAAYYQGRDFGRPDDVFATFIIERLPLGAVGLTLAAVFAAAMSTLSGSLNSSAAAAVNDFYIPWFRRGATPEHVLRVTRGLTVFFGLVQIGVGIGGQYLARSVVENVLSIAGFTIGVVLGVFFLGVFTRRVGQAAALVALVSGLTLMTCIKLYTPLAWTWFAVVGSMSTFAFGWIASLFWPQEQRVSEDVSAAIE